MVRPGGTKKKNAYTSSGLPYAKTSAFVTKKGALRIKKIAVEDAGIYSCLGKTKLAVHALDSIQLYIGSAEASFIFAAFEFRRIFSSNFYGIKTTRN